MKINLNKWMSLAISAIVLVTANSCVKNRNFSATDFSQVQANVELLVSPPTSSKPQIFRTVAYDASVTSATNIIYVNYAGPGPAPKDIVVTLSISPATLSAYNVANGSNFVFLPTNAYSFNPQVTIKAGTYFTAVPITFNPSVVNLNISNAFAVAITDAQGVLISGNYHTQMYAVVVSNPYAGSYTVTGRFFHPAAGRAINATYNISTISGTRSESPLGDLGGSGYLFDFDIVGTTATNWAAAGVCPGPATGVAGSSGFMTLDNPGGADYSDPSNGGFLPGVAPWVSSTYKCSASKIL